MPPYSSDRLGSQPGTALQPAFARRWEDFSSPQLVKQVT